MSVRINFSVLSYYPSFLTNENINIGIAIQSIDNNYTEFYCIKKWARVEHYDDELDIDIFKATVHGIKEKMTTSLTNNIKDSFFNFTKFFVNELKFSNIRTIETESLEEGIEYIKKIHLKYDFEHHERLNENETKNYVKMLLKSSSESVTQKAITGIHNENLHYDFVVDEKRLIKIIKITDSNLGNILHNAKSWAWTSNEIGNKYDIIFVIASDELTDQTKASEIESILESANAKIVNYDDFISNVQKYVKPSNTILAMLN